VENLKRPTNPQILGDNKFDYSSGRSIIDDIISSRVRTSAPVTAGVATFSLDEVVPVGAYWLVDRISVQVDAGGAAIVTVYENSVEPGSLVSGGNANAGLTVITGAFSPPISVPPNENLVVVVSGIVGLTQVNIGIWYRLRHYVKTPDEILRYYTWQPAADPAHDGPLSTEVTSDAVINPSAPPPTVESEANIETGIPPLQPLFTSDMYADDVTMR
jgi:hypothetical protein